jgi:hypothetical protein
MRVVAGVLLVLLAAATPASAAHADHARSENLVPLGESAQPGSYEAGNGHTDLAFWGTRAYQGSEDGFRILDISDPANIRQLADVACNGTQGDVSVWGDLLIRSVDLPQTEPTCAGRNVSRGRSGFEGLQIFDVSDPTATGPEDLIASVATDCGSHTHTLVPDLANRRVLVYVASAYGGAFAGPTPYGTTCASPHAVFTIVEVRLDDPPAAHVILRAPLRDAGDCHDIAVFTGIRRAVCAGRPVNEVFDITEPANPVFLYSFTSPGVDGWHSASFSEDGEVMVLGWEPGGGREARCQAGSADVDKRVFFFATADGAPLGSFVFPRPQSASENCSWHNYNVVPHRDRRLLVASHFQGGTTVVDFTDPAHATLVAWADPPALAAGVLGGAWSSYYYRGAVWVSDITQGLQAFRLDHPVAQRARVAGRLNPQTQENLLQRPGWRPGWGCLRCR